MKVIPVFRDVSKINDGLYAEVLKVRYDRHVYAAKMSRAGYTATARQEYDALERLKRVSGIPKPQGFFEGNYTMGELGIRCGYTPKHVVCNPFLMDFVPGDLLKKAGPQKPAFFDELETIVRKAHKCGVVHKDIHDENIIVYRGRPVLIDWNDIHFREQSSRDRFDVLANIALKKIEYLRKRLEQ